MAAMRNHLRIRKSPATAVPMSLCVKAMRSISGVLRIAPLARYPDRLPHERFTAVSDTLRVSIAGAGDVDYYGNPQTIEKHVTGVGSIQHKD